MIQANTTSLSQHVRVSPRKFPLDFTRLVGPALWRSLIYLLSCRWWNTRDFNFKKWPILSTSTGLLFLSIKNFYLCYSSHFTNIELVLHWYENSFDSTVDKSYGRILHAKYAKMCRSPYNNINNLREYDNPGCLLCRKALARFLVLHVNRYLVNGRVDQVPVYLLFSLIIATINLGQHVHRLPLTIFHSATRETRPRHSPSRWLAGRPERLF